jgi:hypothetical protein
MYGVPTGNARAGVYCLDMKVQIRRIGAPSGKIVRGPPSGENFFKTIFADFQRWAARAAERIAGN